MLDNLLDKLLCMCLDRSCGCLCDDAHTCYGLLGNKLGKCVGELLGKLLGKLSDQLLGKVLGMCLD